MTKSSLISLTKKLKRLLEKLMEEKHKIQSSMIDWILRWSIKLYRISMLLVIGNYFCSYSMLFYPLNTFFNTDFTEVRCLVHPRLARAPWQSIIGCSKGLGNSFFLWRNWHSPTHLSSPSREEGMMTLEGLYNFNASCFVPILWGHNICHYLFLTLPKNLETVVALKR